VGWKGGNYESWKSVVIYEMLKAMSERKTGLKTSNRKI
jgi:hypothetical protein